MLLPISLLRDFSAPVILDYAYGDDELALLLAHDRDPFNRWEAGQRLFARLIGAACECLARGEDIARVEWPARVLDAVGRVLADASDPAFVA